MGCGSSIGVPPDALGSPAKDAKELSKTKKLAPQQAALALPRPLQNKSVELSLNSVFHQLMLLPIKVDSEKAIVAIASGEASATLSALIGLAHVELFRCSAAP